MNFEKKKKTKKSKRKNKKMKRNRKIHKKTKWKHEKMKKRGKYAPKPRKSGSPESGRPEGWGLKGGARRVGPIFVLFLSLGVFSWNFGVFDGRETQMCTFGSRAVV